MTPLCARRPSAFLAAVLAAAIALAGCGSTSRGEAPVSAGARESSGPDPELIMTGPASGYLVWTGGAASVVLATSDGFRTLTNETPPAVPTDGGLVLSRDGSRLVAGVATSGLLRVSPFLVGDGSRTGWAGGELPGAIDPRPGAVALQGSTVWAVVGSGSAGRLVSSTDTGASWHLGATATGLDPTGHVALVGVGWTDLDHGWLSATATSGRPALFAATGSGAAWLPVALPGANADSRSMVSAGIPCRSGEALATLVVTRPVSGAPRLRVLHVSTRGGGWRPGVEMPFAGGQPVLACGTADLWLAMPGTAATRLLVSTDQGETWRAAGSVPGAVSALAITGAGTGYAVTGIGRDEALWSVSEGGSEAAPVPLPSWVAKLAAAGAA